jgi:hypothetical protein
MAVLVTGLVLPLVAGLLVFVSFSDGISDRVEPVERPEAADPGGGAGSRGRGCERKMKRYLSDLSEAFGKSNATAALFIEASNDFGPASSRYRALIDIYGEVDVNTLMAEGKTKRALKSAAPKIRAACTR